MQKLYTILLLAGLLTACSTHPDPKKDFAAYIGSLKEGDLVDSFHIGDHFFLAHYAKNNSSRPTSGTDPFQTEQTVLHKDSTLAKRSHDSLQLQLQNGTSYTLVSNTNTDISDSAKFVMYQYQGYDSILQRFAVKSSTYRNAYLLLIDATNGDTLHLLNTPLFSPNKTYLFCTSFEMKAENKSHGFELYQYEAANRHITRIGAHKESLWEPGPVQWIANDTLSGLFISYQDTILYSIPVKIMMH